MKKFRFALPLLAASLAFVPAALSQVPAGAPAGSTGVCNDGSYWTGASKMGACRGHKGVKTWFGASSSSASTTAAAPAAKSTPAPKAAAPASKPASTPAPAMAAKPAPAPAMGARPAPAAAPAPMTPAPAKTRAMPAPAANAAPGGGAGQVWVNTPTKVYHCSGDRYYGKTKDGKYMSEKDAMAEGDKAARGKPCSAM